ncbi:MAG: hypothetical protein EBR09_15280, partial [Proteobacteria bacterium]|nr:hypothetical protein [Pseudomonadota bacterium]
MLAGARAVALPARAQGTPGSQVSIKHVYVMDARWARTTPVRIKRENLLKQRPLRTNVSFGGERLGGLLSREKVQAAMQMMRPGDTVTLHDEACRWTLACAAPNAVSVRCTRPPRAAGGALLGLSATLRGDGMAVRGTALDAQTLGALAYMNNQMLPRREGCAAALGALRTGAAQGPPAAGAETAAGAGPGARAPHLWLSEDLALFDRFGTGFTLLCMGKGDLAQAGRASARA